MVKNAAQASVFAKQSSIISPAVDFFMVGGLTFLIFPFLFAPGVGELVKDRSLDLVFLLMLVLGFPHFIHGYQLLYHGYGRKILSASTPVARFRYVVAGIVSPLAIVGLLAYGAMQPTNTMLGYAANAMFFLTGWHYVKQGYGIMMALSAKKKVYYSKAEKYLLLSNAYVVWIFSWIEYNALFKDDQFHEIPFKTLNLSADFVHAAEWIFAAWTLVVFAAFIRMMEKRKAVSINGLVAYLCSLYLWAAFANMNFLAFLFIPALHSLQYLLFVWKMEYEKRRVTAGEAARRAMLPFLAVGLGAGLIFFYALPMSMDSNMPYAPEIFGSQLFMFCFMIFLNVHHYFIDFAIWRRDNPDMKYIFI